MKKIIILSLLLLQSFAMKLYAQSWSNWVTLSNNKGISASVAFLIRNGKNGGISYWKTSNSTYVQGGSLFFSFDYIDDKGKPHTETGGTMIDLSKTGVVKDAGYWFVCNGGSITNIRVTKIYLPNDNNAAVNNNSSSNNDYNNNDNNGSYNNNNRPLNFGTQSTNSNTRNLAQDMQGLLQTQDYLNQQQAQLQQTNQIIANDIQGIGHAIQGAKQANNERKAALQTKIDYQRAIGNEIYMDVISLKENAAEKLGSKEMEDVADMYNNKHDDDKTVEWYNKAIANGSREAMMKLSVYYLTRNTQLSDEWFQKYISDTTDAKALYALGDAYYNGHHGYPEDYVKALKYFTKAAEKGDVSAMYELAIQYNRKSKIKKKFRLVKPDENKFKEWVQKEEAMKNHMSKIENQNDIDINQLQQAAANGDAHAMFELGEYYEKHDDGVLINEMYSKAKYWYQKAAQAAGN